MSESGRPFDPLISHRSLVSHHHGTSLSWTSRWFYHRAFPSNAVLYPSSWITCLAVLSASLPDLVLTSFLPYSHFPTSLDAEPCGTELRNRRRGSVKRYGTQIEAQLHADALDKTQETVHRQAEVFGPEVRGCRPSFPPPPFPLAMRA